MSLHGESKFRKNFLGIRPWRRHGFILLVAGITYVAIGVTYIFAKPTEARRVALSIALAWFPIEYWGSIFVIVGFLAIFSSRWPPVAETWGYAILSGLSAGWSATYVAGIVFSNSPISNLTIALIWGLLAFLWVAISGLVNPERTIVVVVKDNGSDDTG